MKDSPRTEEDFLEWLSSSSIFVGYARYAQFGTHGFVCATCYEWDPELGKAVDDLDGGDMEAAQAAKRIRTMDCWYACDPNPATAMTELVEKLRRYYFDELNGGSR